MVQGFSLSWEMEFVEEGLGFNPIFTNFSPPLLLSTLSPINPKARSPPSPAHTQISLRTPWGPRIHDGKPLQGSFAACASFLNNKARHKTFALGGIPADRQQGWNAKLRQFLSCGRTFLWEPEKLPPEDLARLLPNRCKMVFDDCRF